MDTPEYLDPIFKPRSLAVIGASDPGGKMGPPHGGSPSEYRLPRDDLSGQPQFPRDRRDPFLPFDRLPSGRTSIYRSLPFPQPWCRRPWRNAFGTGSAAPSSSRPGLPKRIRKARSCSRRWPAWPKPPAVPLVGPNCMGLWSSPVNLNLAFEEAPHPGSIAFISQSGTLGNYLMLLAKGKGYGFNRLHQQREPGPPRSLRLSGVFRAG